MKITLKDGSVLECEKGLTAGNVAQKISEGLFRNALCAKVNGVVCDLDTVINDDSTLEILTFKDEEGRNVYRHTTAHILAQAVKSVFPTCHLAIGPSIENGFYYDFDFKTPITKEDLPKIEEEMQKIIKANHKMVRKEVSKAEALKLMTKFGESYKIELINDLKDDETITLYEQGAFVDLCRGPHLPSTGMVKAFKLTSITGAYWRGNEKNKMLSRIYGTAFDKKSNLEAYLKAVEEAKLRDHNKLGRELGYFTTVDVIGQGLPILLPKGARTIQLLQRFVEDEEQKRGYLLTKTPFFAKSDFYKISGHWDHYKENMFILGDEEKDKEVFALRPMTCPFQFQAYLNKKRSYRDLPMRLNETSTLFRKESSGEMHGLIRVRQFTISEGHLACTPSQLEEEFKGCLDLATFMLKTVGLYDDVSFRFSKWDENDKDKYIGSAEEWEAVQDQMRVILDDLKINYVEASGEAAFYGPKLDIQIKNVHGKEDTLITIQIDFQLAKRFKMEYVDENGEMQNPYVIHRTSIGCYERTLALLIEKYAGALPLWLSPTQVKIMNITDRTKDYAYELNEKLMNAGIRTEVDDRNEKIGYKIREAQLEKTPYMLLLGDKELEAGEVAVRSRKAGDLGSMKFDEFLAKILLENNTKIID